ncbi:PREDICTED: F-box/kelch-repeat protein At4g14905-like [Camelina sativa]|uniref:F-box/kelch-repeat protein At4g14905-like n=1 Tax=Camelina sativa TaxID=90675 RepID=A0ABM0V5H5_CAMSA|nr:PREDICTED: F-box/kelch-repeat protein At4g14905-like [Camelina sativa]
MESCIARLPLSDHPLVSRSSKQLHAFIESRDIFKERSLIKNLEDVIYVAILGSSSTSRYLQEWFAIHKKPYKNEYVLILTPAIPFCGGNDSIVSAGSKIYSIGGSTLAKKTTSEVLCFDCATYKSLSVSKMNAIHSCPETAVIDHKLYVIGGSSAPDPVNLPSMCQQVVLGRKIYFISNRGLSCTVFDTETHRMERDDEASMGDFDYSTSCVIGKQLYAFNPRRNGIQVNKQGKLWEGVKGLPNLLKFDATARLLNCNGKLLVIENSTPTQILITSISLQPIEGEMWGEILSRNVALELPCPITILHTLNVQI